MDTPRDRMLEVVLVGNPIMHHLVLGIDLILLGSAPIGARHGRAGPGLGC